MDALEQGSQVALRMGHLGMIQGVISRLSSHSATVKNFSLTVYAGVLALGVSEYDEDLVWIAALAPLLFALLDAYYLASERSFRDLYHTVATRDLSEAMDVAIQPAKPRLLAALARPVVWPFYLVQSAIAGTLLWRWFQ